MESDFRKLSSESRRLNRAKVHFISSDEAKTIPGLENFILTSSKLPSTSKYQILPPEILYEILLFLITTRLDVDCRRGDIIVVENLHNSTGPNSGKYIFDGIELLNLSFDADVHGNIPLEFQAIIEFPPRFWSEIIDHNLCVPFIYSQIGPISTDNVMCLSDVDKTCHFAIKFNSPTTNEEVFIITYYTSPLLVTDPKISQMAQRLLKNIQSETYFSYYDEEMKKFMGLPEQIDPEHVLIYDFKDMFT